MSATTRHRCTHCGRFISAQQAIDFSSCDDCLDNALPDSNEGGYTRIRNQFDVGRRAA